MSRQPAVILATEAGGAGGSLAEAAALAVAAAAQRDDGVLMVEMASEARPRRPTLLASDSARALEQAVRGADPAARVAARGSLCWLTIAVGVAGAARGRVGAAAGPRPQRALEAPDSNRAGALAELESILAAPLPCRLAVVHLPAELWARALDRPGLAAVGGLIRADIASDRELAALAVAELHCRGLQARVSKRAPGPVAARRSLAGLEAGGERSLRARRWASVLAPRSGSQADLQAAPAGPGGGSAIKPIRESGQALPLVLGAVFAVTFAALILTAIGGAVAGKGRAQRAADLAALSAARSMRDDFDRLLAPARLPDGTANGAHLTKREYLARALAAAHQAGRSNGVDSGRIRVRFPDQDSFAPLRARVRVAGELDHAAVPGSARSDRAVPVVAVATAEASTPASAAASGGPARAAGGGYTGPLAYRQGKPIRPDVAAAFDRMAATARSAGVPLVISSAFRSDAEQAALFARNRDPRWVAPPGRSLHRCATELDLGPPGAYGWLAANAGRFGFLKRYGWEPWHYGFTRGPAPCSAAGDAVVSGGAAPRARSRGGRSGSAAGRSAADGPAAGTGGLPAYVPAPFRTAIQRSAARWNVSASLLAAQLMAESNFNPTAISPAGARGIAQFMPGTAAAYGLRDPFDAGAAIDAQAHLMSDLLKQFGSIPLALAAYNAGPGAVAPCSCIPPYPETRGYVARIMGLLDRAGELAAPALEVRLVA